MMKIADDDADEVCSINTLGGQLRCLSAANWSRREAGPTRGEGGVSFKRSQTKGYMLKLQQQQQPRGEQVANKNKNNLESIKCTIYNSYSQSHSFIHIHIAHTYSYFMSNLSIGHSYCCPAHT